MIGAGIRSFRTQLVLGAAITVVLIQLVGAVVDFYFNYARLSDEMDARGQLIVEQTAATIAGPIWDFDTFLVEEVLQNLSQTDSFARVAVLGVTGEAEVEHSARWILPQDSIRTYSHPIIIHDGTTVELLGTLQLDITTADLRRSLHSVILNKLLIVLAVFICATGGLSLVLGRLSKPLEDLRRAVHAIEREDFALPVPAKDRSDEIGALANALDGLREREAELAILRRANTEKSRREGKRILQALETTRDAVVLIDEKNVVIFTNRSAKTHFPGLRNGSILKPHNRHDPTPADSIRSALMARQETDTEISVRTAGAERHFQARTGPIIDSAGNDLGGLFLASDFTEQVETARRASFLASHDPLTGLVNRRHMDSVLSDWISAKDGDIGVMLVDLDHFKAINDTLGHPVGDSLLIELAHRFSQLCDPGDLTVRLGGDEFAILSRAPKCEKHLEQIATGILASLVDPVRLGGRSVAASVSAGIATTTTADRDITALMRQADLALYEAKQNGRGRFEVYQGALLASHERRHIMEGRLTAAIEAGRIFAVFQPQIALEDGCVAGFEALARWDDPELGFVSPGEFIPLAETANLIEGLTRNFMIETCKVALDWCALGFDRRISVNISPHLFDGAVVALVRHCLTVTGCPPDLIELEITESVLLSHSGLVQQEITDLQAMGLTIALDDFGTGYSSLDYLRRFPVDKIKIDRAFVSNIAGSQQSRAIVTAVAQLGHSLGMVVIGEGAETQADRLALKGCGVDIVQGFVDGMPEVKSIAEQRFITDLRQHRALG